MEKVDAKMDLSKDRALEEEEDDVSGETFDTFETDPILVQQVKDFLEATNLCV